MFVKILLKAMFVSFMCMTSSVSACTLFAAQGAAVKDGGLIVVKNRDAEPGMQSVRKEKSSKYSYYGLYGYTRKGDPLLLGGVNEKGLVVIHSKANVVEDRYQDVPGKSIVNENLLKYCATVEECLQNTKYMNRPCFLLLGDSKEIATVEIAPKRELHIERTQNSTICHANHYTDPALHKYNAKLGASTVKRQKKIEELLANTPKPLALEDFIIISEDRSQGLNDSIWRDGVSYDAVQTISRFLVYRHPDNSFDVRVDYRPSERKSFKTIITNNVALFGK